MSGRTIDASVVTASQGEVVRMVGLVSLDFSTGIVRVNTTPFDILFDSDGNGVAETFQGVGDLGKIGPVQETTEIQAVSLVLELSGIDPSLISIALGTYYQGRAAKLWLAFLDDQHRVIATPMALGAGRIDTMEITRGATATISLTVENPFARWDNPLIRRYSDHDQQQLYPGDLGCQFIAQMVDKQIIWGGAPIE